MCSSEYHPMELFHWQFLDVPSHTVHCWFAFPVPFYHAKLSRAAPHPKWTFSRVLPKVCQHMMRPCVPLKHACILRYSTHVCLWERGFEKSVSQFLLSDICCNLKFHRVHFQLFWEEVWSYRWWKQQQPLNLLLHNTSFYKNLNQMCLQPTSRALLAAILS